MHGIEKSEKENANWIVVTTGSSATTGLALLLSLAAAPPICLLVSPLVHVSPTYRWKAKLVKRLKFM
jgi:hypothetical protein